MATNPNPLPNDEKPDLLGTAVPDETQKTDTPSNYGPRNERLPEQLQKALVDLVKDTVRPEELPRRREVLKTRKAHLFYKGQQHIWLDSTTGDYQYPTATSGVSWGAEGSDDQPRYNYVINIYQPFVLSLMAVLSQQIPETRLWPESSTSEEDITTAKAGSKVIEFIERNNDPKSLLQNIAFHLCTGGKVGGYARYVVDGQRFGFKKTPIMEQQEIEVSPEMLSCPSCGYGEPTATAGQGTCPTCGAPANIVPPRKAQVPKKTGEQKDPNGQEVVDIVGGLELKTPIWAECQDAFPYLVWSKEIHEAKLKATYPEAADKITSTGPGEQDYERLARLQTSEGGQGEHMPYVGIGDTQKLKTFHRAWLRPWLFEQLKDEPVKKQLQQLFPDGVFVAMAGDAYCESRNESMDDRWRVIHAMPGDGQDRPGLCESIIPVQEILNDEWNLSVETYEYGIPATFVDSEVIDIEALEEQTSEPGAMYPIHPRPGQPAEAGFFSTPMSSVPPDFLKSMEMLFGPVPQFLTGAFPALQGAEQDQKTAAGQAMQRDQALGRMGLPWGRIRTFYSEMMLLAFECFKDNRTQDVESTVLSESDEFEPEIIKLAELKGNVKVYPETDENFPTSWAQKKAAYQQVITTIGDTPEGRKMLSLPGNVALGLALTGLEELEDPDEDSRLKQYAEIAQMLQEEPAPGPEQQTPTGPMPGPLQSSVPVDMECDNHEVEAATCLFWINSKKGQMTKKGNQIAFANVKAHFMEHKQALAPAPEPKKPPSVNIPVDKMPPEAQAQFLEQEGVHVGPQDFLAQAQLAQAVKPPPVIAGNGKPPTS